MIETVQKAAESPPANEDEAVSILARVSEMFEGVTSSKEAMRIAESFAKPSEKQAADIMGKMVPPSETIDSPQVAAKIVELLQQIAQGLESGEITKEAIVQYKKQAERDARLIAGLSLSAKEILSAAYKNKVPTKLSDLDEILLATTNGASIIAQHSDEILAALKDPSKLRELRDELEAAGRRAAIMKDAYVSAKKNNIAAAHEQMRQEAMAPGRLRRFMQLITGSMAVTAGAVQATTVTASAFAQLTRNAPFFIKLYAVMSGQPWMMAGSAGIEALGKWTGLTQTTEALDVGNSLAWMFGNDAVSAGARGAGSMFERIRQAFS